MAKNEELKILVKKLKYQRDITQAQICKILDIQPPYLSDMINGRKPVSTNIIEKIESLIGEELQNIDTEITDNKNEGVKDRLLRFLKYLNLSQLKFEESVNLSRGFVNNIGDSIRESSLQKIKAVYPELNVTWLKVGIGEMILDGESEVTLKSPLENPMQQPEGTTAKLVPLLPISAQGGSLNDFVVSVKNSDCEKVVSPIKGADYAIPVSGDSMAPEYPNGSHIFIKKINERAFIEWGKVYVLDTCNGTVVKVLVPSEKEGFVKCLSINKDPIFAPFDVAWGNIYGVYRVLLCMSVK